MASVLLALGHGVSFPIMYHWRIQPNDPSELNVEEWGDINKYCQYWESSSAILKRVEYLNKASAHIALFLEYIPHNLHAWLPAQIAKGNNAAERAVTLVDKHLNVTNRYMNTHGLMHFDAHFKNVLTDGKRLYFSDFGLALSSKFDLSTAEIEFLKYNQHYDQSYASLNILLSIFGAIFKKDPWDIQLRECISDKQEKLSPTLAHAIKRYMPIALCMDEFLEKLRKESKSTPYPATQLEKLLT
jgi:hypothetical protein